MREVADPRERCRDRRRESRVLFEQVYMYKQFWGEKYEEKVHDMNQRRWIYSLV